MRLCFSRFLLRSVVLLPAEHVRWVGGGAGEGHVHVAVATAEVRVTVCRQGKGEAVAGDGVGGGGQLLESVDGVSHLKTKLKLFKLQLIGIKQQVRDL